MLNGFKDCTNSLVKYILKKTWLPKVKLKNISKYTPVRAGVASTQKVSRHKARIELVAPNVNLYTLHFLILPAIADTPTFSKKIIYIDIYYLPCQKQNDHCADSGSHVTYKTAVITIVPCEHHLRAATEFLFYNHKISHALASTLQSNPKSPFNHFKRILFGIFKT